MNFLLNENISRSLQDFLISLGFTVFRVGNDTPRGIRDIDVITEAKARNAIVITRDCSDFGEIVYRTNTKPLGIICIKGFAGMEEAEAVKELFTRGIPLSGYFTFVEKRGSGKRIRQNRL